MVKGETVLDQIRKIKGIEIENANSYLKLRGQNYKQKSVVVRWLEYDD